MTTSTRTPNIPAISADVPINTRRVLLAMKTTIEYLLTQVDSTRAAATGAASLGGTTGTTNHNSLGGLQGGGTNSFYHLTGEQAADLTDGGASAAHYHPSDRDLANATGTLTWDHIDPTGATLADFGGFDHEDLGTIQGGAVGEHFHLTAEQWAFLLQGTSTALHFHDSDRARANHTGTQDVATITGQLPWTQIDAEGSNIQASAVVETAVPLTLDDTIGTCVVTATGVVVTLPKASAALLGYKWTVLLAAYGYNDITTTGGDVIVFPVDDTTLRLDTKGAGATLRCLSDTTWGLV